jgi:hypothetical protein
MSGSAVSNKHEFPEAYPCARLSFEEFKHGSNLSPSAGAVLLDLLTIRDRESELVDHGFLEFI